MELFALFGAIRFTMRIRVNHGRLVRRYCERHVLTLLSWTFGHLRWRNYATKVETVSTTCMLERSNTFGACHAQSLSSHLLQATAPRLGGQKHRKGVVLTITCINEEEGADFGRESQILSCCCC